MHWQVLSHTVLGTSVVPEFTTFGFCLARLVLHTKGRLHRPYLNRRSEERNIIVFSDSVSSLKVNSIFKLDIDLLHNIITHVGHAGIAAAVGSVASGCLFVCLSVCLFVRVITGKRLEL